jgi:hypothetical protein
MNRRGVISFACLVMSMATTAFAQESAPAAPNLSPTWLHFQHQKAQGVPTDLPDFSYAGYDHGNSAIPVAAGKRFAVTDFGAIPDDLTDDRAAIQRAIDAAKAHGGGIVTFPPGRFLVNTDMNDRGTLVIDASHIILQGAGSRAGGTIIHQIQPFGDKDPNDPTRMHLGDTILKIASPAEEPPLDERPVLAAVTADSPRETFTVTVDRTDALRVGDHVYLYAKNRELLEGALAPFAVEPEWTGITQGRARAVEIHQIAALQGLRVTFAEPIHYDLQARHGWELRQHQPLTNVGVEDLAFMGNAWHNYTHHRSQMDDGGWAIFRVKAATQSYIRRCSFLNCSQSIYLALVSRFSILNNTIAGSVGHHATRVTYYSTNTFDGLTHDQAGCTHGPSLQGGAVATVFWRWTGRDGSIDSHAGMPYASLFDRVHAARISSSGGRRDYPQHLRHLVLWNTHMNADRPLNYDFWQPQKSNVFVLPSIIGMHGSPVAFNTQHLALLESHGTPVDPPSLYEAQLALRLGQLPHWIAQVQREQQQLDAQPLPPFHDRNDPQSPPWFYPETFSLDAMLKHLTNYSLQAYHTKLFTYTLADENLTLASDQSFVRHALYMAMNALYRQHPADNTIHAQPITMAGKPAIRFTLTSGPLNAPLPDLAADPYLADARAIAARIGGTLTLHTPADSADPTLRLRLTLDIPPLTP